MRMMVLDMRFEEATESPEAWIYGISIDGRRLCCKVNDFPPYFWFPAPVFSSRDEVLEKLGILTDVLNHKLSAHATRKSSTRSSVAQIHLGYKTPLMFYRPGGPFPFLKIEVLSSKTIPACAKALSSLAKGNELKDLGLVWKDTTSYEENIKYGMRFCCDTSIAGGAWVDIKAGEPSKAGETRCDEGVRAGWRDLTGLSFDATHYMERDSGSNSSSGSSSSEDFASIPALRVLGLNVLCSLDHTKPGSQECLEDVGVCDAEDLGLVSDSRSLVPSRDPVRVISNIVTGTGEQQEKKQRRVVFVYSREVHQLLRSSPGIQVRCYSSEAEMLLSWQKFVHTEVDPDIICLFQLKDSLRYMVERFKVLKLGVLDISRLTGRPTQVKSVVTYGKQWVKQQARMSATSNQEVFRATVEGRIVVDMLRIVLVAYSLSTFTLGECSQVLLGRTKEVLSLPAISKLCYGKVEEWTRLMYYSLQEAQLTMDIMERLQTIPETIEMARVTGLTLSDVLYKAQMIRVQSLLLRAANKEGWLLGGPTLGGQLSESPHLLHPREQNTVGFYEDPVCILDFASLYPSVFIAYNLCYTTYLHPEDVELLSKECVYVSPTGANFVKQSVRHGVLPRICGALIRARKLARDKMALSTTTADEKAVLDGRQRALKLCSNALYGFTGAGASPQQALPLADSCLRFLLPKFFNPRYQHFNRFSIGASLCKSAITLTNNLDVNARVVYAQTDSVFVQLRGATLDQALSIGKEMATGVSSSFPQAISLKFERVLHPFLLLQVNRYAGRQYVSSGDDKMNGTLFVRGLESDRRDVPYFVRRVCKAVLESIIVRGDKQAAVAECKRSIKDLLSGRVSMYELLMTGGLWRVDDNDITRLAKSPQKNKDVRATAEEGRGPHVALAVRMKRKNPDRQFHIGERIPYVLVVTGSKLQDEMAEDPVTALAEDLPLNLHIYLENKLRKPLESILEHVIPANQMKEIFTVSHTVASPARGSVRHARTSVSSFFKKQPSCLVCRDVVDNEDRVLCRACLCTGAESSITAVLASQQMEEEKKFSAHSECLRCHSGGFTGPVLCSSTDCPMFFLRHEACKRLDHLSSMINKLSSSTR